MAMTPDRWRRIKEVLDAVEDTSPAERRSRLDELCGADGELRRQVEGFLEHEDRLDDFIEEPALPVLAQRAAAEPAAGRRIGPYRMLRLLGRGGMGTVYLAAREDEFEQRVALKLLPAGLDTDDMIRRFQNERQILARLEHPYIARLLDGGTSDDGLPYFAMEHIEGEPLDRYCDDRRLDTRQRLELFLKVCSALEFAHRNLVIHRDLKPSNILVDASGTPKLLDFGIAKLLRPEVAPLTVATRPGSQPMTLHYACPEHFRDEPITTASDIYVLGLLLYQLLTGRLPCRLESRSYPQLIQVICEEEPVKPSDVVTRSEEIPQDDASAIVLTPESVSRVRDGTPRKLARRLAGDVDTIVLKTLRKEPSHRYASVEQLSADLRRHLEGLPVEARQGDVAYRFGRFVRRHRWRVVAAAALLLLALGLSVYRAWQLEETERALARAEKVSAFLVELFSSADPDESARAELTARELVDRGRRLLEAGLEDEPEVRAPLLTTLGQVYIRLGRYEEARELLQEAVDLGRDAGDHPALAEALGDLATSYLSAGDRQTAEPFYRNAIAMRRRLGDEENLVKPMNNLAGVLMERGEFDEAEELYRQGLRLRRAQRGGDRRRLATNLRNLGNLLYHRGEIDAAEPLLREALELRLAAFGPQSPAVATVFIGLGRIEQARGRWDEAERLFVAALEIRRRHFEHDHYRVASVQKDLASLLLERGEPEAVATARVILIRVLQVLRRSRPADDWNIADAEGLFGYCLLLEGRLEEAGPCLVTAVEALERARGEDWVFSIQARRRLASLREQPALRSLG